MIKNTNISVNAEFFGKKIPFFLGLCLFFAPNVSADQEKLDDESIAEHRKIGGPYAPVSHIPGPANPHTSSLGAANGGTGRTTLTQYSILIGEGTSPVNFAVPGNSGIPLISTGATSDPVFGTVTVSGGGTGIVTATPFTPLVGGTPFGTSPFQSVASVGATGGVLTSNGAALPTYQTYVTNVQVFTTTGAGVYTPTSGMRYVQVEAIAGGGGSGGGAGTTLFATAGGGSGSYSRKVLTSAQVGTTMAYIVGAGGTAGASGGGSGVTGTATSFGGTFVTTLGGVGSVTATAASLAGGAGGALGTGGIVAGFNGGATISNALALNGSNSGAGGNSVMGQGGYPVTMNATGATPGTSGQGYGAGAGGGTAGVSTPAVFLGGTGAQGAIIITEYILV